MKIKQIGETNFKFNLGAKVQDAVTGYKGIVICRTQWLNCCNVYGVKSQVLKEGKPLDTEHFDEPSLELIVPKEPVKTASPSTTGGSSPKVPPPGRL